MLHTFSALALVVHVVGSPIDSVPLRREELMTALRSGGCTVLLRHARTDRTVQRRSARCRRHATHSHRGATGALSFVPRDDIASHQHTLLKAPTCGTG